MFFQEKLLDLLSHQEQNEEDDSLIEIEDEKEAAKKHRERLKEIKASQKKALEDIRNEQNKLIENDKVCFTFIAN